MKLGRSAPCHCGSGKKYKRWAQFGEESIGGTGPLRRRFLHEVLVGDADRPAGSPMHFVVVPRKTVTPLPENEVILLAEALFQYGDVPQSRA